MPPSRNLRALLYLEHFYTFFFFFFHCCRSLFISRCYFAHITVVFDIANNIFIIDRSIDHIIYGLTVCALCAVRVLIVLVALTCTLLLEFMFMFIVSSKTLQVFITRCAIQHTNANTSNNNNKRPNTFMCGSITENKTFYFAVIAFLDVREH